MPLLSKRLLDPLKQFPLPGVLFCMTQEHCALWYMVKHLLYCLCQRQHTCWYNGNIVTLRFQKHF
jgi:hypothetical protein